MSHILDLPAVRRRVAPISVETYHTWSEQGRVDQRTELLRGVIVEKMTKSPLHVMIVNRLCEFVAAAAGPGLFVRKEDPLTLADSEPEPDIAVVVGRPDDYRTAHPSTALLVAEIAVSSEDVDREKIAIYAEAGVAEFWLVLPDSATIEAYTGPQGSAYRECRRVARGEVLVATTMPGLRVSVDALFA